MRNHQTSSLSALALVLLLAACAPAPAGPPDIVVDYTACSHCSMLISEPRHAAAYRVAGREAVFDDIGCLLDELSEEPNDAAAELWFGDVVDGNLKGVDELVFIRSQALRTPMAGGIVATADPGEVERLRSTLDAAVFDSFAALRAAWVASTEDGER